MQKRARRTQDTEIVILCTKKLVINLNRFGHIYLYKFLKLNGTGNRDKYKKKAFIFCFPKRCSRNRLIKGGFGSRLQLTKKSPRRRFKHSCPAPEHCFVEPRICNLFYSVPGVRGSSEDGRRRSESHPCLKPKGLADHR